jgi:hypothetical protein
MFFSGVDGYPIPCDGGVHDTIEEVDYKDDRELYQRYTNWVTTMCNDTPEDPAGGPVMDGGDSEETQRAEEKEER